MMIRRLVFLMGCLSVGTCSAMEIQTAANMGSCGTDVQKLFLEYIFAQEDMPSAVQRIGLLRTVCRRWKQYLHDPRLLQKIFGSSVAYPKGIAGSREFLTSFGRYLGSILSKKTLSPQERDFVNYVKGYAWDRPEKFHEVLEQLIIGPHCTVSVLRNNAELLECALALYIGVCLSGMHNKELDLSFTAKLRPFYSDDSILAQYARQHRLVAKELVSLLPKDEHALARKQLSEWALDFSHQESQGLTYESLDSLLKPYSKKVQDFIALNASQLYDFTRLNLSMSSSQRAFLTYVYQGEKAKWMGRMAKKPYWVTPELVDLALLLALKTQRYDDACALLEVCDAHQRPAESALLHGFIGIASFKTTPEICLKVVAWLRQVAPPLGEEEDYDDQDEDPMPDCLSEFCVLVESEQELDLFCKLGEQLKQSFPRGFFTACFAQDVAKITKLLPKICESGSMFDSYCLCWAVSMAHAKGLTRTLGVLRNTEIGAGLIRELEARKGESVNLFSLSLLQYYLDTMRTATKKDLLKPYWVDSFLGNFAFTQEETNLMEAVKVGNKDACMRLLDQGKSLKPLFLECMLLCAYRHGHKHLEDEFVKRFPDYAPGTVEHECRQTLIEWILFYKRANN